MEQEIKLAPVIAHRGASADYPENTWLAFEQARLQGVTWLEFDVWVSSDDVPVIFHDELLERMTDGVGRINESNFDYLSSLKVRHQGQLLANERIVRLDELLVWLNKHQLVANIELKGLGDESALQHSAMVVCDLIKQFQKLSLIISSFSLPLLIKARHLLPDHKFGLLVDIEEPGRWHKEKQQWRALFKQLECYSLHVNQLCLDEQQVRALKRLFACPLLSYTVNDAERARELLSWGVDAVFSDYPNLLANMGDRAY